MRKHLFFLLFFVLIGTAVVHAEEHKKVEIYLTSWCPYCAKMEKFLKQNKVDYERYDVEKDTAAYRVFSELGGSGVPLVRVHSKVIYGYDPEAVMEALKT